ncbi:MAG: PD40 domain-containing protein [Desulfobulbaceae bacterium]|nr:PD40 domain-containing protein [Desulfobulbaceae bacterium]
MIGRKKTAIYFCLVLAGLFLLAGCSTVPGDSYVVHEDNFTINKDDRPAMDNSASVIKYISSGGELTRISPERSSELAVVAKKDEVLEPIDVEFKAAVTPELLAAFVVKYAPTELAFVALQRLARPAIDARNWSAAVEVFEKYRDKFSYYNDRINSIVSILGSSGEVLTVANLGGGINTAEGEYNPVVSSDGKKIYFARDCGVCNGGEEVYVSQKGTDGRWGIARSFGEPLSSRGHEIPLGVSADGNTLAVYGHYDGSLGRGDIFYVEKTQDGWGGLQHYPAPINSGNFESNAMYTADGKAILFVSTRPGGVGDYKEKGSFFNGNYAGNTDIYVYTIGAGSKSEIINLGSVINTPFGEYSPFLHPDGKTLYFSSDGHAGLGGLDVFKTNRLNDDSWTEWSEPVNLGKEVNTSSNDWGYQVDAAGEDAYFARNNLVDGFGGSDIFSVSLPQIARPSGVVTVSGIVTDPSGDPLIADIRWDDLDGQKEVGYASSDPISGEYLIHLPSGGNYGYYAEKSGYIGESEHFDLREYSASYKEFYLDIVLFPIEQPVKIEPEIIPEAPVEINMNNIFFAFNQADLQPESYMEMQRWVRMLEENEHIHLHISGHADSIGGDSYNQKLSEKRAQAVVGYLGDNGIAVERLVAEGFGERQPVSPNDTEEGRQQNRRVQVRIINSVK